MFGSGFALLMQRIGQSGGRRWYLRRLAVLFLIGLLHSAFWWGDILRSYAVAGLLLLPLARMRPRNLAILGVALMYLPRSEEHTSELQSLMRISYAGFCLKKNKQDKNKEVSTQTRTICKNER